MPVVIPKPVYTHRMLFSQLPPTWSTTLYYEPAGASTWTQANVNAIVAAAAAALGSVVKSQLSAACALVQHHGRMRTATQDLESYVSSGSSIGFGELGDDMMPPQSCAEIQRRTGKPGRNMRGRVFLSGVPEEYGDNEQLDPSKDFYAALSATAAAFGADITSGAFTLHARHWNRKTNTLEVVTECRPMLRLVSRRDRVAQGPNIPY